MTAPTCKLCGRTCAKSKGVYLPACAACWENYLNGDTRDTGAMAQRAYTPPLERDGLKVPAESTVEWQRKTDWQAHRTGIGSPWGGQHSGGKQPFAPTPDPSLSPVPTPGHTFRGE